LNFSKQIPEFEARILGFNGDLFEMDNIIELSKTIKSWLEINADKEN